MVSSTSTTALLTSGRGTWTHSRPPQIGAENLGLPLDFRNGEDWRLSLPTSAVEGVFMEARVERIAVLAAMRTSQEDPVQHAKAMTNSPLAQLN